MALRSRAASERTPTASPSPSKMTHDIKSPFNSSSPWQMPASILPSSPPITALNTPLLPPTETLLKLKYTEFNVACSSRNSEFLWILQASKQITASGIDKHTPEIIPGLTCDEPTLSWLWSSASSKAPSRHAAWPAPSLHLSFHIKRNR